MLIFLSESASRKTPIVSINDCDWYRFEGKRKVSIENKEHEADIEDKDVFGIKAAARNKFYVLHRDDPSVVFVVDATAARSLLGRSRPFTGTVSGIRVKKASDKNTPAREKMPAAPREPQPKKVFTAVPGSKSENTKLTQELRKTPFKNCSRLEFLARIPMPTGGTYNYYDASETFASYKPAQRDKWETDLEKAVVKQVEKGGYLVGAAFIKFDDAVRPVLIIVED
ncbi:hypothetical protein pEaSNUABM14_00140 [Erwinia phage pEa_SNUABM_14]|uniref:KTSC and Metallopeptidase-like N-terminal fusion domain-containing protein n=1 Tax=Erwinia phage pEa_SNUABM_7 TaxID=2866695 RepID=A0AAE8BKL3_9CAUD|nr:hypothetical protein MPK74_gp141 [Erwinia phage pEa_SNUABM_7]QYW03100.1 hypothetical protein pEaSNUABM13_00141 [Erwinia phage pEa_SNUABM_13]QYW03441.1 hypothetical protein pEaSNUABM34_00139 [Erwinia phage pEa_SNUABM_34]QYW03783.1 hypothetical protein pEaSNUABM45_00140 [Erwinia phage pEa_SNUABM_45]QYW04124.1 hypothetical protein pEaSNUABM46_00140 [Erwinia phage pEa_SNUABM_46]QYW04465.1 hypothetical protein pEaSNUABM14_00140 [Erwinia phage pEa_SNUABM_14]QYW05154.1 hypothetical protein pEaSNU